MALWPDLNAFNPGGDVAVGSSVVLSSLGIEGCGVELMASYILTGSWGTAASDTSMSTAQLYPVSIPTWTYITRMSTTDVGNGTTENFDLGIYDEQGNRRVSIGSVLGSTGTIGTATSAAVITPAWVEPGAYYFAIMSDCTTVTGKTSITAQQSATLRRIYGVRESTQTGLPLPATVTFKLPALTWAPRAIFAHGKAVF